MCDQLYWIHLLFKERMKCLSLNLHFSIDPDLWYWICFPLCPRDHPSGTLGKSCMGQVGGAVPFSLTNSLSNFLKHLNPTAWPVTTGCIFSKTGHFCKVSYIKLVCRIPSAFPQMLYKIFLQIPNLFQACVQFGNAVHICVFVIWRWEEGIAKAPFGNIKMLFPSVNMGFPQIETLNL